MEKYDTRIVKMVEDEFKIISKDIETTEFVVKNNSTKINVSIHSERVVNGFKNAYSFDINLQDVIKNKTKELNNIKQELLKHKHILETQKDKKKNLKKIKKMDNELKEFYTRCLNKDIRTLETKCDFMLNKLDRVFK